MVQLNVNGISQEYDGDEEMPLLWYLREIAGLKGTKFGCGIAQCGACTVHLNGVAARSCVVPMAAVDGSDVRTIEGLAGKDGLHPVQQAWIDEDVPQCGYCQAGQIMAAVDLLEGNDDPSNEEIERTMTNICRCGTYTRIRKAVRKAARDMRDAGAR